MKEEKKAVFKFEMDYGRMGELEGVFISTVKEVDALIESGYEVYFGEALGKHSEVYGKMSEDEIFLVSEDENVVKVIEENGLEFGYNPFDYVDAYELAEIMKGEDEDTL